MPLLEEGQLLRDTYEVERFLGEGGFAEVYRVKHRFLGRQALKVFKHSGMSVTDVEGALGEALLLSRLGHPNIVRVFDANTLDLPTGIHGYFTMENVAGGTLDKFWRSHGASLVPIEVAVDLIKQVCRGLAVAHSENPPIIHRDIKPQNILVRYDTDGLRARVSDFGLARAVNPLTLLATAAGTLPFKAPEALLEVKSDSCAGDIWALGVTLYLLLTDRLPVAVDDDQTDPARRELFERRIVPPSDISPLGDAGLDRIVLKSLQYDPTLRYQNAGAMLSALNQWHPAPSGSQPTTSTLDGPSKLVLGNLGSAPNEPAAALLVAQAIALQRAGQLAEAADLMEEAFNHWPALRSRHQQRVALWRRGISM